MSTELRYDGPSAWRLHVSVEALAHVACEVAGLLPEGVHAQAVGTQISIWSNRGAGSPRVVEMKDLGVPGDAVTAPDIPTETVPLCSGRHPGNGHGPPAPELAGGIRNEQRTSPAGSARRRPGGNRVCGPFRSRSAVHAVPRASRAGMSCRRRLTAGVPVDDEAHRSLDLQTPCPHTQRVRLDKDRLPGRRDLPSVRSARRHHNDQRTTCGGDLVGAQRAAGRHGEHSRASVGQSLPPRRSRAAVAAA